MSNLEKYLQKLSKEEEVKEEKITLVKSPNLEEICKSYEKWLKSYEEYKAWDTRYNHVLKAHSKKQYTSKDIEDFSIELLKYQDRKYFENTGLFLSALINKSKAEEFTIVTEHLDKKIDFVGCYNIKILNVKGDAGNRVGEYNEGTISVGGNAGNNVGYMNEGTVLIEGDAGDCVGLHNKGTISVQGNAGYGVGYYNKGTISVQGNAGDDVGHYNEGTINVKGKIKSLAVYATYYSTSKIYEGNKLIVSKGE